MKKPKQHCGVRRLPVPGKAVLEYLQRMSATRRDPAAEDELEKYLASRFGLDPKTVKIQMAYAKEHGLVERRIRQRKDRFLKNLTEFLLWRHDGDENAARQELASLKNQGRSTFQMFITSDEFGDYLRMKRRQSAGKNWKKALKSKDAHKDAELTRNINDLIKKSHKAQDWLGFR
jgi:hypothetical protein